MRLEHFMASHALRTPDKPAVIVGAKSLSYGELLASSRSLAAGLRRAGVAQGDRIVVYLPNCVEFVQLLYAAFFVGAIVIPVNTRNTPRELLYFAQDSQARVLVFHAGSAASLDELWGELNGVRRVAVGGQVPGAESFDALRTHSKRFGLDASKVVAVGHSAGAHLALWLAARAGLPASSPLRSPDPLPIAPSGYFGARISLRSFTVAVQSWRRPSSRSSAMSDFWCWASWATAMPSSAAQGERAGTARRSRTTSVRFPGA